MTAGAGGAGARESSASSRRIFSDSTLMIPRSAPSILQADFITRAAPNKPGSGAPPGVGLCLPHSRNSYYYPPIPIGGIAREGIAAMAGLRDRPLIRGALLAGGVIAGSCIAVLIAVDRGQAPRPHFVSIVSAPIHSEGDDSTSRLGTSGAATKVRRASPAAGAASQQIGSTPSSPKEKSSDMTLVVMVPDLPPRENPGAPPRGVWSDQGSAAPVTGANSQAPGLIAMSAVGGGRRPILRQSQTRAAIPRPDKPV